MFLQNPEVPIKGTELLEAGSRYFINSGCELGFAPSPLRGVVLSYTPVALEVTLDTIAG